MQKVRLDHMMGRLHVSTPPFLVRSIPSHPLACNVFWSWGQELDYHVQLACTRRTTSFHECIPAGAMEPPQVYRLEIAHLFHDLSEREKLYSHYMAS